MTDLTDSPQFRRAVEAFRAEYKRSMAEGLGRLTQATDAAERAWRVGVAVLTEDTCQTCKKMPPGTTSPVPCTNRDCTNGKIKPLLVEPDKHRAEVLAEVADDLRKMAGQRTRLRTDAADFIERKIKSRSDE